MFLSDRAKIGAKGKIKKSKKKDKSKTKEKIHKKAKSDKNGACVLHCTGKRHFKTPLNRRLLMQTIKQKLQNICFTFYRSQVVFKWQKRCKKRKINVADYILLDISL